MQSRLREIGIRTALGAHTVAIVSAVARRAALRVGIGLALGVAWGWVLLDSTRMGVNAQVGDALLALVGGRAGRTPHLTTRGSSGYSS